MNYRGQQTTWLKFVRHSTEAHHIREIFNGAYGLVGDKEVQSLFFDRINYLLNTMIDSHTKSSLENLREDIEDEIETGRMRDGLVKVNNKRVTLCQTRRDRYLSRIQALEEEISRLKTVVSEISKAG